VEALSIIILLIVLIGYWALIALGMITVLLSSQIWMTTRVSYLRGKTIKATDLRVRVVFEATLIRLYAWEDRFLKEVRLSCQRVRYGRLFMLLLIWLRSEAGLQTDHRSEPCVD